MASIRRTRLRRLVVLGATVGMLVGGLADAGNAYHWSQLGWRDSHVGYPNKPYGYTQIVNRFGQPCNVDANKIYAIWTASDNGVNYTVRFHKKLGGFPTSMVTGKGGTSTNLDNDVYGHVQNNHRIGYFKSGIWGYVCRYIAGTTTWSTHAWGIAVDISASYEGASSCTSTTNKNFAHYFTTHRWRWGLDFCDPMHFQYAFDY